MREKVNQKIASSELPRIGTEERDVISEMLADVAPNLGKDETALDKVTNAVLKAYLHRPMREILKRVWDRLRACLKRYRAVKEGMIYRVIDNFEDDSGCGGRLIGGSIAKLGIVYRAI